MDERSKQPKLTPEGIALVHQALPAVETADEKFFSALNLKKSTLIKDLKNLSHVMSDD